jgi:hypothetical protein
MIRKARAVWRGISLSALTLRASVPNLDDARLV